MGCSMLYWMILGSESATRKAEDQASEDRDEAMDEDQSVDGSGVDGEEKGTAEEGGESVGVAEEGEDGSVPTTGFEGGDKGVAG